MGDNSLHMARHRNDIDGLRCIAVILVVLFHLRLGISGGFIGVDIFFVISGYLISGAIYRELRLDTFSFAGFYQRRVRRIVPALVVLLLFCSLATYCFFMPKELINYSHSLIAATLSYSNLYFLTQSDYFKQDYDKILLHTWSLSVEEQFYLAFPVAAYLLRRKSGLFFLVIVVLVILSSFALAEWMVLSGNATAAFYLPSSRAWELLLGSAIALSPEVPLINARISNVLAVLAILMIATASFRLSAQSSFPGANALFPCLGTALLIVTGNEDTAVSRLLSTRPMVFVGSISYSVYLWHWPLMILASRGSIQQLTLHGLIGKLTILAGSLLAGWLSWLLIEQPFRTGSFKRLSRYRLFTVAGASGLALLLMAYVLGLNAGHAERFPKQAEEIAAYADPDNPAQNNVGPCQLSWRANVRDIDGSCFTKDASRRNILLLGDSHAGALWFGLAKELKQDNIMEAVVTNGCVFTMGSYDSSLCGRMRRMIYETYLPSHPVELIVITERWSRSTTVEKFAATLAWLHKYHLQVIVVGPVPEYDAPLPLLLAASTVHHDKAYVEEHLVHDLANEDREMMEHATSLHYKYLSPYQTICGSGRCIEFSPIDGRVPMLRDTDHLTNSGAAWLVRQWVTEDLIN